MSSITSEENFWKYTQALGAIKNALRALDLIKTSVEKNHQDLPIHFWTSFFVNYYKPFTNNKKIGMISDSVVPEELRWIHESCEKSRNKVFGHTDALHKFDDGEEELNRCFVEKRGDMIQPDTRAAFPAFDEIPRFEKLAKIVHQNILEKLNEYSADFPELASASDGVYRLRFDRENGKKLEKIKE